MCCPRYCLTHHPGISSNFTNATHFSTPPMTPTLTHRSLYPYWRTNHAGTSPQHAAYITHASMATTLAHHSRQHVTKQTHHPRQHASHACAPSTIPTLVQIARTHGYPIKLLKHLVFIFTVFTFQAFLSIFIQKSGKLPQKS